MSDGELFEAIKKMMVGVDPVVEELKTRKDAHPQLQTLSDLYMSLGNYCIQLQVKKFRGCP